MSLQLILKPAILLTLKEGQKVEHQKFGFGEVMKMEGAAHNPIATVKFEHNGEKKIMLNYAKLRIIGSGQFRVFTQLISSPQIQ